MPGAAIVSRSRIHRRFAQEAYEHPFLQSEGQYSGYEAPTSGREADGKGAGHWLRVHQDIPGRAGMADQLRTNDVVDLVRSPPPASSMGSRNATIRPIDDSDSVDPIAPGGCFLGLALTVPPSSAGLLAPTRYEPRLSICGDAGSTVIHALWLCKEARTEATQRIREGASRACQRWLTEATNCAQNSSSGRLGSESRRCRT